MRYCCLIVFLVLYCSVSNAQVDSLNENFNVSCMYSGPNYPYLWSEFNNIAPLDTLAWNCSATKGRGGTPGMRCLGYYGGAYHLDTAWLFTPGLDLSVYPDSVYFNFDSKYEIGEAKLSIYCFLRRDSMTNPTNTTAGMNSPQYDISDALFPIIDSLDSLGWVTHQVNLTPYKGTSPLVYVAFRYTSTTGMAGAWALDNVNTSPYSLYTPIVHPSQTSAFALQGYKTGGNLNIVYTAPQIGTYTLALFSADGRLVQDKSINSFGVTQSTKMDVADLKPGVYILKMWNGTTSATAKVNLF